MILCMIFAGVILGLWIIKDIYQWLTGGKD